MIKEYRNKFNKEFTQAKYEALLQDIGQEYKHKPKFKVAETPIFIPNDFKDHLLRACNDIWDVISRPDFKARTQRLFQDENLVVPNETDIPKFVQFDFGICLDDAGNLVPKLIELQGFPSLYFYQELLNRMYKKHYNIPAEFSPHLGKLNDDEYVELLRSEIVGDEDPKQVVLLEIEPELQATSIDFYATEAKLGIKILCISDVIKKGKKLYYLDDEGQQIRIIRIYNRVIFDELRQRTDLKRQFYFKDDVDVKWIGHPSWFFRISKFTMPLLEGPYVPKSFYLDQIDGLNLDLNNYVLKPLFSFAGTGINLNVTQELIDSIDNKEYYLLQEKVVYHPAVDTLDEPAKCEIRMLLLHSDSTDETRVVCNLMRLSKGEMIGVSYNKDKTWVGGTIGYFEPQE